MNERTCGNCRWWDARTKTNGLCRRNPPAANGDAMWAEITAKGWCGEWADKTIALKQERKLELEAYIAAVRELVPDASRKFLETCREYGFSPGAAAAHYRNW